MIYSRIGRSLSRAFRSRNVINGVDNGGSLLLNKEILGARHVYHSNDIVNNPFHGKLGFFRGYFSTKGAKNGLISRSYLSNSKHFIANARIRRFFSSEAPKKKNYENFYPRQKKEIPKQNEQKSGSKEEGNTDDHGNFPDNFIKDLLKLVPPILAIALIVSFFPHEEKQDKNHHAIFYVCHTGLILYWY